jgi:hypothetical protein
MNVEWMRNLLNFQVVLVPQEELIKPFGQNVFWSMCFSWNIFGTANPNARRRWRRGIHECVEARDKAVSAAPAEVNKVAQGPTIEQSQPFSESFKCHGVIQR